MIDLEQIELFAKNHLTLQGCAFEATKPNEESFFEIKTVADYFYIVAGIREKMKSLNWFIKNITDLFVMRTII